MLAARHIFGIHETILLLLLVLVLGIAEWLEPTFMTARTQLEIGTHAFELAILALPMTLIIISGGIDLSVGATMALSSVILGLLHQAGAPMWLASAGALAV